MTKTDKVIAFLLSKGMVEVVPSGSRKYRKFASPNHDKGFYWVGKAGAIRIGKTSTGSRSISHLIDPQL